MLVVCVQVNKHDIMKYTGDGMPPFCMITIKPISDEAAPPNLACTIFLSGVAKPNRLQLSREVENSYRQYCQFHQFFALGKLEAFDLKVYNKIVLVID